MPRRRRKPTACDGRRQRPTARAGSRPRATEDGKGRPRVPKADRVRRRAAKANRARRKPTACDRRRQRPTARAESRPRATEDGKGRPRATEGGRERKQRPPSRFGGDGRCSGAGRTLARATRRRLCSDWKLICLRRPRAPRSSDRCSLPRERAERLFCARASAPSRASGSPRGGPSAFRQSLPDGRWRFSDLS